MKIIVNTAVQFTVPLDNVSGALAEITRILAIAGVNLEGFFQTIDTSGEQGKIHFVTPDVDVTRDALVSADKHFSEKTILALHYADKPGVVAYVAQMLGNVKINIEEAYLSTPGVSEETVLYVGVSESDLAKAKTLLKNL